MANENMPTPPTSANKIGHYVLIISAVLGPVISFIALFNENGRLSVAAWVLYILTILVLCYVVFRIRNQIQMIYVRAMALCFRPVLDHLQQPKGSGSHAQLPQEFDDTRNRISQKAAAILDPRKVVYKGCCCIRAKHSDKYLEVPGATNADGVQVRQSTFHGDKNQQWMLFKIRTNDHYFVVAKHSAKCLDISRKNRDQSGAKLSQYEIHGGDNQQWKIIPAAAGYCRIIAVCSGKCLDVWQRNMDDGALVTQSDDHKGDNQTWKLEPVW